eukprot:TRINITY_DN673_c0_g2_i1.p1 TRINITY_DN673_c0_g2~~TRINITY_DN673_c0_g2_i1.p1  ORF type:complete len:155 (-),score=35.22 TRINITY_DN673_c0_g2_i1:446-910(-)
MGVKYDNIQNFFAQKKKDTGIKRKEPGASAKVAPSADLTAGNSSKAQQPQQQKQQRRKVDDDEDVVVLDYPEETTERPRVTPRPASVASQEDQDQMETALRLWDMDMKFGPCIGMSRLDRWERAQKNGLNPPQHVRSFLMHAGAKPTCVWEDRV